MFVKPIVTTTRIRRFHVCKAYSDYNTYTEVSCL